MKRIKFILLVLISVLSLHAEVVSIVPYSGVLNYDSNSIKSSGTINGVYVNSGTLSYLTEFSYTSTDVKYKQSTDNLVQDEFTFIYNRYFKTHALKIGLHTNSTTDTTLENGSTFILGMKKWKWYGYSKFTYGLDYYSTFYGNGENLDGNKTKVTVTQFTPYFSYYKPYRKFTSLISGKVNFETINAYTNDTSYTSYELKDKFFYKKGYLELGYFGGKLRTGIKDGGMTVYNSKDIITQALSAKVGYYINTKLNTSLSYTSSTYDEYKNADDLTSSAIVMTLSYTY
jgi:hypothetical protein